MDQVLDVNTFPFGKEDSPELCIQRAQWDRAMAKAVGCEHLAAGHTRTAIAYERLAETMKQERSPTTPIVVGLQ